MIIFQRLTESLDLELRGTKAELAAEKVMNTLLFMPAFVSEVQLHSFYHMYYAGPQVTYFNLSRPLYVVDIVIILSIHKHFRKQHYICHVFILRHLLHYHTSVHCLNDKTFLIQDTEGRKEENEALKVIKLCYSCEEFP